MKNIIKIMVMGLLVLGLFGGCSSEEVKDTANKVEDIANGTEDKVNEIVDETNINEDAVRSNVDYAEAEMYWERVGQYEASITRTDDVLALIEKLSLEDLNNRKQQLSLDFVKRSDNIIKYESTIEEELSIVKESKQYKEDKIVRERCLVAERFHNECAQKVAQVGLMLTQESISESDYNTIKQLISEVRPVIQNASINQ